MDKNRKKKENDLKNFLKTIKRPEKEIALENYELKEQEVYERKGTTLDPGEERKAYTTFPWKDKYGKWRLNTAEMRME